MDISFTNDAGYQLSAILDIPKTEPPFPVVIFSHGFDSSKDSPRTVPIAEDLQAKGIASFRFDYTGHGDSEGLKEESTFNRQLNDLRSAIKKVKSLPQTNIEKIALHGSSSGCLTCLAEAEKEDYKAVVLRAPRIDSYFPEITERVCRIDTPIFAIQGEYDPMLSETRKFIDQVGTNKMIVVINKADHLFSSPEQFEKVRTVTVAWLEQMLV